MTSSKSNPASAPPSSGHHLATISHEGRFWDVYIEFEDDPVVRIRLLHRLGILYEDLLDDPRLATRRARIENGPSLYQDVAEVLRQRTTAEWLVLLGDAGIPVTEVAAVSDLLDDLPIAEHPSAGAYRVTPPLTGVAASVDIVRRPAPLHGEHNREVLTEIG